jgi:hypothetical protein
MNLRRRRSRFVWISLQSRCGCVICIKAITEWHRGGNVSGPRRQRQIVELLRDRPFASVRELQEQLGSSAATVRRDIEKIDEAGDIGTTSLRVASAAGAVQ